MLCTYVFSYGVLRLVDELTKRFPKVQDDEGEVTVMTAHLHRTLKSYKEPLHSVECEVMPYDSDVYLRSEHSVSRINPVHLQLSSHTC